MKTIEIFEVVVRLTNPQNKPLTKVLHRGPLQESHLSALMAKTLYPWMDGKIKVRKVALP